MVEVVLDEDVIIELLLANVEFELLAVKEMGGSMEKKVARARLANLYAALWPSLAAGAVADAGKRYSDPV